MGMVLSMPGNMTTIWLVAMLGFLVLEAAVPGLISLWFAFGALAAMLASALSAPLWLQLLWFFIVSVATLCLTRPLVKKYINGKVQPTNADALIGKTCLVTENIDNIIGTGAVKVGGITWTARAKEDVRKYHAGDPVTIVAIEGVKLIVR